MKCFSLLIAILVAASSFTFSQPSKTVKTKRAAQKKRVKNSKPVKVSTIPDLPPLLPALDDEPPPPPPPKKIKVGKSLDWKVAKWKTVPIEKWGFRSLILPEELIGKPETIESQKNKDVTWTTFSRSWRTPTEDYTPPAFEVDLSVTTWDVDFAKLTGLRPEIATPENLIEAENNASEKLKNKAESPIEEAGFLEIDRLRGGFYRSKFGEDKNRLMTGWQTYRYFKNKAQLINISIVCGRDDLPQAMKIINSLKMSQ